MMTKTFVMFAVAAVVAGCVGPNPQMGVIRTAEVSSEVRERAQLVQVLNAPYSPSIVQKVVGAVTATSCKNKTWEPPATRGDALLQLRIKAAELGANALTNVLFDEQGTDAWGTNCWQSITASADAVLLK